MALTILQAFQSAVEYSNDNLFDKVLIDRGLTGSTSYTAALAQDVDLCVADIYLYLAQHPDVREGSFSESWSTQRLLEARRLLYQKHGLIPPEQENAESGFPLVDGTALW